MTDAVFDIAAKVTIVTGGSTSIGADIAREFCARGAQGMVTSRTMDHLAPVAAVIGQASGARPWWVTSSRPNRWKQWSPARWRAGGILTC